MREIGGKTTLAKAVEKEIPAIYLDLQSPKDVIKLKVPTVFLQMHADKLTILDEIQQAPEIFKVLRGLIDQNRGDGRDAAHFLILGSTISK